MNFSGTASRNPRVLVVDDDLTFANFICAYLQRLSVVPEVAITGADALRRLADTQFSGLLLDLRLPDMDGLEVLAQLRRHREGLGVVVLTGAGHIPAAVQAMRLGASDFLEKPVSGPVFEAAIRTLLEGRQAPVRALTHEQASVMSRVPERTLRLSNVVVGFIDASYDARTVSSLCRATGLNVAPRTFRLWCSAEGVRAGALLDLARLLRAARSARLLACSIDQCFDADERTVSALLARGFPHGTQPWPSADLVDLCLAQHYVRPSVLLDTIIRRL